MGRKSKVVTYERACELVLAGIDFDYLLYRKTKFTKIETERIRQVLRVEKEIWRIYLNSGKCSLSTFPFDQLQATDYEKVETVRYIVHLLFNAGWTPAWHVQKTRLKYKDVDRLPYMKTLKNGKKFLSVPL